MQPCGTRAKPRYWGVSESEWPLVSSRLVPATGSRKVPSQDWRETTSGAMSKPLSLPTVTVPRTGRLVMTPGRDTLTTGVGLLAPVSMNGV